MTEIVLPRAKIMATQKSPKNLIIFSKPKVGKTALLAGLDDCLILDLEDGSDFVSATKIKATSVEDIKAIGEKIKAEGNPYKYVAIDTDTALEEMCIPYAEIIYARTPMGKNWFEPKGGKELYGTIINLPNGAG